MFLRWAGRPWKNRLPANEPNVYMTQVCVNRQAPAHAQGEHGASSARATHNAISTRHGESLPGNGTGHPRTALIPGAAIDPWQVDVASFEPVLDSAVRIARNFGASNLYCGLRCPLSGGVDGAN